VYTYKYDPQNRMVSTTKSGTTITYAYDPIGRRLAKTVNGVTANYLSVGSQEIAEYDGSSNLVRRYVYGPGIDEPVARVEVAGTHYYHHTDTLGSVIALTDSTDTVTEKHPHTMYGTGDTTAGSAYQFTGRRIDNASGDTSLYYHRNRMYSPTIGRFLSADPIGTGGGLNIYAYVGNDPLNNTDPFGLYYDSNGIETIDVTAQRDNPCPNFAFVCVYGIDLISELIDSIPSLNFISGLITPAAAAQPASQPQSTFQKMFLPKDAQNCTGMDKQFYAPPQFNLSQVAAAGKAGGPLNLAAMNRAVGHFGTFDYQRVGNLASFTFYSGYTPVSNIDVGAYLFGAGFSESQAGAISNVFADLFSNNAGDPNQQIYRNLGYEIAAGKGSYSCSAIPQ